LGRDSRVQSVSVPTILAGRHQCQLSLVQSDRVNRGWCFEHYAQKIAEMPLILREQDVLSSNLLLAEDGPVAVYYCPFDFVNPAARVVTVGITPGLSQMFLSCREAQRVMSDSQDDLVIDDVLRVVCDATSFGGAMRTNLVSMLNEIGLNKALRLATADELFAGRSDLLHSTSALIYPVFLNGRNYGGSPSPLEYPLLQAFVEDVFLPELALVPDALIIPLGRAVEALLRAEIARGRLRAERCLFEFPHPSPGNGHRVSQFKAYRDAMASQVAKWASD